MFFSVSANSNTVNCGKRVKLTGAGGQTLLAVLSFWSDNAVGPDQYYPHRPQGVWRRSLLSDFCLQTCVTVMAVVSEPICAVMI